MMELLEKSLSTICETNPSEFQSSVAEAAGPLHWTFIGGKASVVQAALLPDDWDSVK